MSLTLNLFLGLGGLLTVVYLALCAGLYWRQTRMIFFPSPLVTNTPAELGLSYEELWLPVAAAGFQPLLHGWWIPNPAESGVLLYLHGNAINIGANLSQAARLHQMGFSVLLMDYRGYGRSEGQFPHEQQVYQDAAAMWQYLVQERQIAPDRIIVYGHSLGGAIAIDLATRCPVAGLIIDGSFTSIRQMVNLSPTLRFFPARWLLTQQFNSIDKIRRLQIPILLIHGTADTRVPAWMSQALYEAAGQPKQLYLVPEAGHNNVAEVAGIDYFYVIQRFTQQTLPLALKTPETQKPEIGQRL
jgi:uncharacterized protein